MLLASFLAAAQPVFGRIMDNTLPRPPVEVDTKMSVSLLDNNAPEATAWKTYKPSAKELSYLGRWDKKYISWWSAPGLKFGFTGEKVCQCYAFVEICRKDNLTYRNIRSQSRSVIIPLRIPSLHTEWEALIGNLPMSLLAQPISSFRHARMLRIGRSLRCLR